MVVVGQREQQEVVEVLAHELPPDARGVLVAGPGPRQRWLAGHLPGGVELAVEELVRAPDSVPESRRQGDPAQHALEADLVPAATAVDEKRRTGRAYPGIAEDLEHRLRVGG